MTSTQHTGVVVSAKEADAWHAAIKLIMETEKLDFGDAVSHYIAFHVSSRDELPVDMSGWDAA